MAVRLMLVTVVVCLTLCTLTIKGETHEEFVEKVKDSHTRDGSHNKDFDRDVLWGDGSVNEGEDEETGENEVENLPPEEQKRRLRLLVENRIDQDKDGFVSMDELVHWTERSYDLFETEETRAIFPDVDRNKDGAIQWPEYALDAYGEDFNEESEDFKNPPSDEWQEFVKTYLNEKKKFEAADLDHSDDLDTQEFQFFKHPRLHENTRSLIITEALEMSDLNNDGAIDLEEFLGDYEKKEGGGEPEWTVHEKEKFEHDFDVNKDGVLKDNEILSWMAPDNKVLAVEEAEHLMEDTDVNRDDKLSIDEILSAYTDWVDSDATDYGRQLLQHHDEL